MMREKIIYIAEDGVEFSDETACAEYERRENMKLWYQDHALPDIAGGAVPIHNVTTWLRNNRGIVLEFLRGMR